MHHALPQPSKHLHVAHRVAAWLPLTETWINSQIANLPPEIISWIFCEKTLNSRHFPTVPTFDLSKHPADRLIRKLGRAAGFRSGFISERRALRSSGIQLLHSHFGNVGWSSIPLQKSLDCPHVVTFYGFDVNQLPSRNARWRHRYLELFASVDAALCEGPHMAECLRMLGAPAEKVRVHRLGIGLDRIPFRPRAWLQRSELRVLMAASFREKKGLTYGIEALKQVALEQNVHLTLIGDASSDAISQAEKRRIDACLGSLPRRMTVTRLGYVGHQRLHEEAAKCDIFLSPSVTARDGDTEGGAPVALIEMAASGMPIVSTRHCDIPGTVIDGETSLLAPERDVQALVEGIEWWTRAPDQWLYRLNRQYEHVCAHFDAKRQGMALADIYATFAPA